MSYGVYFYCYEFSKIKLKIEVGSVEGYIKASFLSGLSSVLATTPFWVVHRRVNAVENNPQRYLKTAYLIVKNEGLMCLYRGVAASFILLLNPIIQFVIYEKLKILLEGKYSSDFMVYLFCGAVSKAIATLSTFPFQNLRMHAHLNKDKKGINFLKVV